MLVNVLADVLGPLETNYIELQTFRDSFSTMVSVWAGRPLEEVTRIRARVRSENNTTTGAREADPNVGSRRLGKVVYKATL